MSVDVDVYAGRALTREQILAADDLPRYPVEVPEWGGVVFVRHFTAEEQAEFEKHSLPATLGEMVRATAGIVARAVCDEAGVRLFTDEDVPALVRKNAVALRRIVDVINEKVVGIATPGDA